jgi:hypothetical protein
MGLYSRHGMLYLGEHRFEDTKSIRVESYVQSLNMQLKSNTVEIISTFFIIQYSKEMTAAFDLTTIS